VKVGDLVKDTRHSPGYIPRLGLVLSIIGGAGSVCRVQYPGGYSIWAPLEALEIISESR